MAVTVERLVAICRPLHARLLWQSHRIIILLICIYVFSFLLFVHQWFWMFPGSVPLCNGNGRRVYGLRKIKRSDSPAMYDFVLVSQYLAIACTFVIPVIAMMFLNSLLLYFLRRNRRDTLAKLVPADSLTANTGSVDCGAGQDRKGLAKRRSDGKSANSNNITTRQRTCENKIAFMVSVIIISFMLCLSPSAILYVWETIFIGILKYPRPDWMSTVALVSNYLVITNKAMNFVLYCSAGKHFRRKLLQLICKHLGLKRYYYENRNTSRSFSRADNYTLATAPGPELTLLRSKVLTSNGFKHRSLECGQGSPQQMSTRREVNGWNDEEARFCFWRKSPDGYTRQTSFTPSPRA